MARKAMVLRYRLLTGYVCYRRPGHPRATSRGFVYEHILIVEAAIGKPLRATAEVHHVDEVRSNNANGNLVACQNRSYHQLLHQRARALAACGDPSALPCNACCSYDRQSDMRTWVVRCGGRRARHRDCAFRAYRRKHPRTLPLPTIVSRYIGVCWNTKSGKWQAQTKLNRQAFYLGVFDSEAEAGKAYDAKSRELGRPESRLNFPSTAEVANV